MYRRPLPRGQPGLRRTAQVEKTQEYLESLEMAGGDDEDMEEEEEEDI